jgi:hypothetical protein
MPVRVAPLPPLEMPLKISKFVDQVSAFFNQKVIESYARETGFVVRESKLTGHLFLSIFTFGMSIYGTPTLDQLIGLLNLIVPNLEISREGLHQRINAKAVLFFEHLLSESIRLSLPKSFDLKVLSAFKRAIILDSTVFELPGDLAEFFKGSGGSASNSSVKIQFGYDLKSSHFFYRLQDGVSPDNSYANGFVNEIREGDLIIRDLGYSNNEVFLCLDEKGAYYLSRLKSLLALYQRTEKGVFVKFKLLKFLKKVQKGVHEIEVYLKNGLVFSKIRLVIERVPDAIRISRLKKLNEINKKKGRRTAEKTKIMQGFNLHISNVPRRMVCLTEKAYGKFIEIFPHAGLILASVLKSRDHGIYIDLSQVCQKAKDQLGQAALDQLMKYSRTILDHTHFRLLYTIRWQVELIFKNWKSNFTLDKLTGKRPERILCMIYAKLLHIFLSTKIIFVAKSYAWATRKDEVSDQKAGKHLKLVAQEWLRKIIQSPHEIESLLKDAVEFIAKRCIKIEQKDRTYPLKMLEMLEYEACL